MVEFVSDKFLPLNLCKIIFFLNWNVIKKTLGRVLFMHVIELMHKSRLFFFYFFMTIYISIYITTIGYPSNLSLSSNEIFACLVLIHKTTHTYRFVCVSDTFLSHGN